MLRRRDLQSSLVIPVNFWRTSREIRGNIACHHDASSRWCYHRQARAFLHFAGSPRQSVIFATGIPARASGEPGPSSPAYSYVNVYSPSPGSRLKWWPARDLFRMAGSHRRVIAMVRQMNLKKDGAAFRGGLSIASTRSARSSGMRLLDQAMSRN